MTDTPRLVALAAVALMLSVAAFADKPDQPNDSPRIGDRVVFFTDNNGDGFLERSPALVVDAVNTVIALHGYQPGQIVNLYVFESEDAARSRGSNTPEAFYSLGVARGREHGRYDALTTSNQ